MAGGLTLISHANPFIQVPRRQERIATSAPSSPCAPAAAAREAAPSPSCSWAFGAQLAPWGPLSFRARCGACACGRGRAGLGAARRGSAVGYFNERCQGLQRGEERREKPSALSKLGLGRGGPARCCGAASATHSAPAGPQRRSGSGHGGFSPHLPFPYPACPSPSRLLLLFVLSGGWEGTWGERQLFVCRYGICSRPL